MSNPIIVRVQRGWRAPKTNDELLAEAIEQADAHFAQMRAEFIEQLRAALERQNDAAEH